MKLFSHCLVVWGLSVSLADEPVNTNAPPAGKRDAPKATTTDSGSTKSEIKRESGRTVFEVEYNGRGENRRKRAEENGGLGEGSKRGENPSSPAFELRTLQRIYWNAVPKAVQEAIAAERNLGALTEVKRDTRTGRTLYHVSFDKAVVTYSSDGQKVPRGSIGTPQVEK